MKTSRFSERRIIAISKPAKAASTVPQLCREHGISNATFCKRRARDGSLDALPMARMKELDDENRRLKNMHAE